MNKLGIVIIMNDLEIITQEATLKTKIVEPAWAVYKLHQRPYIIKTMHSYTLPM